MNFGRTEINILKKFDTATIWVVCKWKEEERLSLQAPRTGPSFMLQKAG